MAYLNGNKVFLYGERTVDANLTTKTIKQNGTYNASSDNADGYSSVTVDVTSTEVKNINYIFKENMFYARVVDFKGNILKEQWLNDGETFILPEPLVYEGLVFDGWSSSSQLTKTTINGKTQYSIVIHKDLMVGALYHTSSGKDELDIELTPVTGLDVDISTRHATIYWGDGTSDTTSDPSINYISFTHTYESYGKYTIYIDYSDNNSTFNFNYNNKFQMSFILKSFRPSERSTFPSIESSYNMEYLCVSKNSGTIGTMKYCFNLKTLILPPNQINSPNIMESKIINYVIPYNITSLSFVQNTSIDFLCIPNSITALYFNLVVELNSLYRISLPSNLTKYQNSMNYCRNLIGKIIFPSSMTTITGNLQYLTNNVIIIANHNISLPSNHLQNSTGLIEFQQNNTTDIQINSSVFNNCSNLLKVKFGPVSSIASSAFGYCSKCQFFDFTECTSVPTLANANAFNGTNAGSKILVPSSLYNQWITETNWSSLASRIVPVDNA